MKICVQYLQIWFPEVFTYVGGCIYLVVSESQKFDPPPQTPSLASPYFPVLKKVQKNNISEKNQKLKILEKWKKPLAERKLSVKFGVVARCDGFTRNLFNGRLAVITGRRWRLSIFHLSLLIKSSRAKTYNRILQNIAVSLSINW